MLTAPAQSTAVPASADDRETACRGQTAHLVEKGFRPMNGLLALGERPAGVMAVTTVSALLSRISGSTQVGFGDYLRDLCDDLAATCGRPGGPKLTCASADEALPLGAAITLGLIADLLITNAFLYAFPPGRGGRIAVSFAAGQEAWLLTVEDSGIAMRARASRRENGLTIARLLVARLRGRLEIPIVIGGTCCIVTIPRPMREGSISGIPCSVRIFCRDDDDNCAP
jgi:two-component sensor histidine kinase